MTLQRALLDLIADCLRPIGGGAGVRLRRAFYRRRLGRCGTDLTIAPGVYIEQPDLISVGNAVHIDKHCILTAGVHGVEGYVETIPNDRCRAAPGQLLIGDRCHIAAGCIIQAHGGVSIGNGFTASAGAKIYSMSNSPYRNRNGQIESAGYPVWRVKSPVAIGNNVWIGLGSIVIGHTVGDDAFIKPLSVVISDIPPNSVVSGNPAGFEKARFVSDK